ncbi:hypothetical protein ABZ863_34430 [Saccharomonospora sp. NPDC046836]|uniref:hypothetical protein n=1 Tax=Saccharomonospora sp. NPDC046836 TaxID=3156921 RepID=UPI0033D0BE97
MPSTAAQQVLLRSDETPENVRRSIQNYRTALDTAGAIPAERPSGSAALGRELQRTFDELAFGRIDTASAVDSLFAAADRMVR